MQPVKAPLTLLLACLAVACLVLAHGADAAEVMPVPRLRPTPPNAVAAVPVPRPRPTAQSPAAPEAAIPVPQARPAPGVAATPPQPGTKPVSPPQTGNGGWPAAAVAAGRAECAALLAGLPLTYKPIDPIGQEGGCGTPAPIEISAVAGVTLAPPATETCAMAAALASWVTEDVQPMARQRLGTEVTGIRTATSYACRFRNNGSSGKMSEHSKANALDMSGFTFAKQVKVTVGGSDNWGDGLLAATGLSKSGSFLEDIRKAACTHFTTVLGPGSDPYHGDHFHVDVLQRKGGYRICQ